MKKINTGFTLAELIVVVLILTVLITIFFRNFQGYTLHTRDVKRISDIFDIKSSLGLYYLEKSEYPLPDNGYKVSYEGDFLWNQGVVGDNMEAKLSKSLKEKPTDPLTEAEYIYSVTNNQLEYEILALYESNIIYKTSVTKVVSTIYSKVEGMYNKIFIKTPNYIVPTPSIINAEINGTGLILTNDNIKSQVTTGGNNIPINGTRLSQIGGLDIILNVYTGSINKYINDTEKEKIALAIQNTYIDSILVTEDLYSNIINKNGTVELVDFVDEVVLKDINIIK